METKIRSASPMNALLISALTVFLSPLLSAPLTAQETLVNFQSYYQSWEITGDSVDLTITQWAAPIHGQVPLQNDFEVLFYAAGATNDLDVANNTYSLSGASDVRVQVNRTFANSHMLFGIGINVPTGKQNLNYDIDTILVNALSENFLSFPLRSFGQGFGLNLMLGGVTKIGQVNATAGVMYEITGAFDPYRDRGSYNPGNLLGASVGVDYKKGSYTFKGSVRVSVYGADRLEGAKVFDQNTRVSTKLSGSVAKLSYSAGLALRYTLRGRNTQYGVGEVIVRQLQLFGDEFAATADFSIPFARSWSAGPNFEFRSISGDELPAPENFGSSTIIGAGASLGARFSPVVSGALSFKYYTGSADDSRLDISGFSLSLGLFSSF